MAGNDIPRGRRRICKSGGRRWGRGRGGSRVIFHAELMDAASFSSPRYFWPAFHDRDANLFQFCCRGTRTHNDHPNPEFFTNATRQLCSSRAILSNIFISFLEKLYYTDLLLFFVLILKSSRSDVSCENFCCWIRCKSSDSFFICQVGITCAQIVRVSI